MGSSGYKYDQARGDSLWKTLPKELLAPDKPTWGFDNDDIRWREFRKNDRRGVLDAPDAKKFLQGKCMKHNFSLDQGRLKDFENILERLQKRNIRMLAFTPPWHYHVAGAPGTDDDGTSQADYDKINEIMRGLEQKYPNFRWMDINNKANHDFKSKHFGDYDHLNPKGAEKLTRMIDSEIQRLERSAETGEK